LLQKAVKNNKTLLLFSFFYIALISLPYVFAFVTAGKEYVFGGFLLNPIDGNTYLAKMYQGWSGEWKFTLPYTAEKGTGTYLFLFYLGLGHISRILQLPLVTTFHLARVAGAVYLLIAMMKYLQTIFINQQTILWRVFLLAVLGSGVGWLAIPAGQFTSDFWVAEAYPFLSAYATPHFAIGLALLLTILRLSQKSWSIKHGIILTILSFLLAIIQPFGIVIAVLIQIGMSVVGLWREKTWRWKRLLPLALGGGLPLIYQYWVIQADPLLAAWNAQNITSTPPVWDLILSFSPALFLALYAVIKKMDRENLQLPIIWMVAALLLLVFPFNLQRRFMLGMYVPVAILAGYALMGLDINGFKKGWMALFLVSILTNILVVVAGIFGSLQKEPAIFLTQDEFAALQWIRLHTEPYAVILASPEMGRFIPAHTGRRVLYGHPFETVDAAKQERIVLEYYAGDANELQPVEFEYVFFGPREREIGRNEVWSESEIVFQSETVIIFRTGGP